MKDNTIEIEIKEAILASNSLKEVSKFKFKPLLAYKLMKLNSILEPIFNRAEEIRINLIKNKYGELNEDGNYTVSELKVEEFKKEYSELLSEKESINFEKFKVTEFDGDEKLTIQFFIALDPFIIS